MYKRQDQHDPNVYFVPHGSKWPVFASVFLFTQMVGLASWMNHMSWGKPVFFVGLAGLMAILFKWFADVIAESLAGHYNKPVSYTHLDVYKRQSSSRGPSSANTRARLACS